MSAKPHSKLGIVSCIIAGAVWLYFALAFYLVFFVDGFTKRLSDIFIPESKGISDLSGMGVAVVLFAAIFFFIPAAGHSTGALFGLVGVFRSSTKRMFAVAGIVLNVLPIATLFLFWLIGSLSPAN